MEFKSSDDLGMTIARAYKKNLERKVDVAAAIE